MNVKELKDKIALKRESCLPKELVDEIKDLHTKLSEGVKPEVNDIKMSVEAKTLDGKVVATETEFVEGAPLMVVTEEAAVVAEDGEYTLEDGTVLTVVGGLITAVKKAETPAAPAPATAPGVDADMKAQMDSQKSEIAELKTRLESVTKQNIDLAAALKKILETPVNVQQSAHQEIKLEDMTPYQRYKHSLNK